MGGWGLPELGKMIKPAWDMLSVMGLRVSTGGIRGPEVKSKALARKECGSHQHVSKKLSHGGGGAEHEASTARHSPTRKGSWKRRLRGGGEPEGGEDQAAVKWLHRL